jgi:hypothetical protein
MRVLIRRHTARLGWSPSGIFTSGGYEWLCLNQSGAVGIGLRYGLWKQKTYLVMIG